MTFQQLAAETLTERMWQALIISLSAGVILITIWCLLHDITIIFMHLYYFPIVILAYHYRWKGFGVAVLLSLTYPVLVLLINGDQPDLIMGAFIRFLVFAGVAAVIALISEFLFRAQGAMENARQFQESVITNANIWITVLAPDSTILIWNNAAEQISGYKRAEVEGGKSVWKRLYPDPDYRKRVTGEITRIISQNTYLENFETDIRCADGSKKTLAWNTRSMTSPEGVVSGYIAIGRDITAQKDAEFQAGESARFLATIIDTLPLPIFIKDVNGKYLGCNPPFEEYIGVKKDDLIGRSAYDIAPKDLADRYTAADQEVFSNPVPQKYETQVRFADGTRHDVIFFKAPFFNNHGGVDGLIGAFLDITDRKRREQEILLSNITLQTQQETSPDGILVVDETGKILSYNRRFAEIWEIPDKVFASGVDEPVLSFALDRVINPEGFLARVKYLYEHHNEKSQEEIRLRNGRVVERYSSPMQDKTGRYFGRIWYFHDITERKKSEEALRNSEARMRTLVQTIPDLIWLKDINGIFLSCNNTFERLFGAKEEAIVGKTDYDFVDRELADYFREHDRMAMEAGKPTKNEEWITFADDGRRALLETIKTPMYDHDGTLIGVLGIGRDITERKRAEEEIRESRQLFVDIISFLPDPTFVIDNRGTVLAWNRALEKISGISAGDILGKGGYEYSIWQYGKRRPVLIDLVQNQDADASQMNYTNVNHEGTTIMAETRLTLNSGKTVDFSLVASPLFDSQGRMTGAIESLRDITHIKETEAELIRLNTNLESIVRERTQALQDEIAQRIRAESNVQAALDYNRSVIEANPDMMVVLDREGKILDINSAAEKLTGIPVNQLIGQTYFGFLVDDGTLRSAFARLLAEGSIENLVRIRRKDGFTTPLSVHATVIKSSGGIPDRIIVSTHDITRQKHDEEVIRASLDEKVLLLREIHHRVKNNLQIIISLTNLQMRTLDDPRMKQVMAETRNRVRAMSIVHEKLYLSDNLSSIDLADYTRFLASQLFSFYGVDHNRVQFEANMEKIWVDINMAIPLGLILNELISNALKHAFPEDRRGIIRISSHVVGEEITLIVHDDGQGIPPELNWKETDSLGLRLINSLVDQLNGTIEKEQGEGTTFIITLHRKGDQRGAD